MSGQKSKLLLIFTCAVAVMALAAGIAFFVYKAFGEKNSERKYIECDCDPDFT